MRRQRSVAARFASRCEMRSGIKGTVLNFDAFSASAAPKKEEAY